MGFKKKLPLALFSVLLAVGLALAGCSSNSDEHSSSSSSGDKLTIHIMQNKVEVKDAFDAVAKKYEDSHPNVKIEVESVGGGTDYGPVLKSKFSSGNGPDIYNAGSPQDLIDYKDYLEDLSDTAAAKAALPGTLNTVTKGDAVYGLPVNEEGYGLIYNKKVFKEAGVDPSKILTFDNLVTAVKKLDSKKEELGLDAVFALPAKETWVLGDHLSNAFISSEFDGSLVKAYNSDTVKFKKSDEMKQFLDLQNKYSVKPTLSLDYSTSVEQDFSLKKVAMIQQGNWVYPTIKSIDGDFAKNDVGLLPIPVKGYEGKIPVGVSSYFAVNKKADAKVIKASKDFLDWLYTSDEGKDAILTQFNYIPAYSDFDGSKIADPISQAIYSYTSDGNTYGWVFGGYPTSWSTNVLGANMQKYLAGKESWDDVLKISAKKWEEQRK